MTTEESISRAQIIKETIALSKEIDNLPMDEGNIRKKLNTLNLNFSRLGIRKIEEEKLVSYQFEVDKKEIVKFLSFSENSKIFKDFDIEAATLRSLRTNKGIRHISAEQKKNLVEAFEDFIKIDKRLGLSSELAESNIEHFWKFIRENKNSLQTKVDYENDFFYPYDLFNNILRYRLNLIEIADDEYQADEEFQNFIDRFTELESYLLIFCKEFFIRKIKHEAANSGFSNYDIQDYFKEMYDEDEYDYQSMDSDEILAIITEILINGR
jgi:hypothetical protein